MTRSSVSRALSREEMRLLSRDVLPNCQSPKSPPQHNIDAGKIEIHQISSESPIGRDCDLLSPNGGSQSHSRDPSLHPSEVTLLHK
jgi:hypothetical protein